MASDAAASDAPSEAPVSRDGSDGSHDSPNGSRDGQNGSNDGSNGSRDGGSSDAGFEAEVGAYPYPHRLSETGLFTDVKAETLGAGIRPFEPKYTLWSDGASKRRWLFLPPGSQIDTSDMDYWVFPVGTKVWKEFTVSGVRIETRLQYKAGPSKADWVMIAYQWRDDLSDADAMPSGAKNARGTAHDIPSVSDCQFCHGNMKDSLLGVSAIQLSHTRSGLTLAELVSENSLSSPPAGSFVLPGDAFAEAALGYLHANCGTCHNPASAVYQLTPLRLWESTTALGSVEQTTAYQTTVGQPNGALPQFSIIEPGFPDRSALMLRISVRGSSYPTQMPPIATKIVDTVGLSKVRSWIESLPVRPVADAGADAAQGAPLDSGVGDQQNATE